MIIKYRLNYLETIKSLVKRKRKKIMSDIEKKKEEILKDLLDDDYNENARKACDENKEDWTTSAQEDMLDWIEEQGIYIRQ